MEIIESGMLKEGWSREVECERCQCVVRVGMSDLFQMPTSSIIYACWECPECNWLGDITSIHFDFVEKLPTRTQFIEQKAKNK